MLFGINGRLVFKGRDLLCQSKRSANILFSPPSSASETPSVFAQGCSLAALIELSHPVFEAERSAFSAIIECYATVAAALIVRLHVKEYKTSATYASAFGLGS
jgi:hypothetical protein